MSFTIPGYKTRLSLAINGKPIPIIESNSSIKTPKERIHLMSQDNALWNHLPHEFSLSFRTYQLLDLGPFLTGLQNQNVENIEVVIGARIGTNWTFTSVGYGDGVITQIDFNGMEQGGKLPTFDVNLEFLNYNPVGATSIV